MDLHVLNLEGSSLHLPSSSMKGVVWICAKESLSHLLFPLTFFSVKLLRIPLWPVRVDWGYFLIYWQTFINSAGCAVALPRENEAVMLGAAVLGAVAAKKYKSVRHAMVALNAPGLVSNITVSELHVFYCDTKFQYILITFTSNY